MRRVVVAAAWITGATVPLLLATVFFVGCCVLPFHQVMHKLMPICELATSLMRGEHADGDAQQPMPAREKQEPVKRIVSSMPLTFRLHAVPSTVHVTSPAASAAYRSFISHGAVRCDQDVGLHLLVETFRI